MKPKNSFKPDSIGAYFRMEWLRSDRVVLESLSRVAQEIGFDRVRPYAMENGSYKAMPDMPFTQCQNP